MAMTKVKGLQMWCQRRVEGYRDVSVRDMTASWKSGLAFCALIHNFRPDLIDYDSLSKENIFENNQLVQGIKGSSALATLSYVNLPKVFAIDWMHCVLLGVVKSLMKCWFVGPRGNEYFIGDKIAFLNRKLQSIKVPDFMARTPRTLADHSHWKASECREWLFHFSVPLLSGVMKPVHLAHYALFVSAMVILNKEEIQMKELMCAEVMLLDFCRIFAEIYGAVKQTMNIHMLKHLPHFVKLHGPLFTTSCFGFESMNSHLKSMVHGTRHVTKQAFEVAERELGIPALLEAQDMVDIRVPDKLSVVTYVSQYYNTFRDSPQLGGPGVSVKQTSSSSNKRSPTVQPAPGPEVKRFAPTNDKNVSKTTPKHEQSKKTSTIGDKCVICHNKVYLLERQIENGKLYHRSCFRHSELSPTTKVFKSSHSPFSDDFESKAKVRKTEEKPSWAKSNGLSHTDNSHKSEDDTKKSLFHSVPKSSDVGSSQQQTSKPDHLLERLKSRMETDKKESEIPSYKKNRPLILQVGTKEPPKDNKTSEPPTFNAKKFDKHEVGFLSKNCKPDEGKAPEIKKSGFGSTQVELSKTKETNSGTKTSFPVAKTRHFGDKEVSKVEKMDTSEPFGAKLKHVSPIAPRKTFTSDNEKVKKPTQGRPKTPPFGKKLLISQDKSHKKETVTTPDSPPPPLPTSQPPAKLTSRFSPLEETARTIPSSLPPSVPPSKSTYTPISITTASETKSTNKPSHSKTTTTTTTTTKSILKTTSTSSGPSKPPRLLLADNGGRSESPMDVDEILHRASNHTPGHEPVAVLVSPTEKNPVQEKRLLGGLLASLADVRQKKQDDVKSPTDTSPDRKFPVAKSRREVKSEVIVSTSKADSSVSKSKVELSVPKTKVDVGVSKTKETVVTDKKDKSPFSFVSDKLGIFKKDESKASVDTHSKSGVSSKPADFPSNRTSAISEATSKYTSKYSGSDSDDGKKDRNPPSKPEEPVPSWKMDSALKDQKTSRNALLQDSKVSSKKSQDSDDIPQWKKDLEKKQADKLKPKGSELLLDSKLKATKSTIESSDQVPSWKQRLNDKDKNQQKSSDQLLDSKSKHESGEDDQTPMWMRALEKRKADKARPKSADILLQDESRKSDLSDKRVKQTEDLTSSGKKDRSKSAANILDIEPVGKLSWQMEAQRRIAQNKGGFVDPEKNVGKGPSSSNEKSAPQKKPRTLITHTDDESSTTKLRIPIKPPSRAPPSPPEAGRQLKKISLGTNFDFKSATPLREKKVEPTSPIKTPPPRPPPPSRGILKSESPGRMSPAIIQRQLDDIDSKLTELELKGRTLEDSIRSVDTTEAEDDMMIDWFKLINSKNELVRKEADLIYMSKQQDLEEEQEDIDEMLQFLASIPELEMTAAQQRREADLIEKKMAIVNQRNNIVESIDEDRLRYEEEDKDIKIMLEEKGFSQTGQGKMEKKKPQKEKPRKGAFVLYT